MREEAGGGERGPRRRAAMTELAGRTVAPGLMAFDGDQPVGWIAIAPRDELTRVARLPGHSTGRRRTCMGNPVRNRAQGPPRARNRAGID